MVIGIVVYIDCGIDQQMGCGVFGGVGVVGVFLDVFDGDQFVQGEIIVDYQDFFDVVVVQQLQYFV